MLPLQLPQLTSPTIVSANDAATGVVAAVVVDVASNAVVVGAAATSAVAAASVAVAVNAAVKS